MIGLWLRLFDWQAKGTRKHPEVQMRSPLRLAGQPGFDHSLQALSGSQDAAGVGSQGLALQDSPADAFVPEEVEVVQAPSPVPPNLETAPPQQCDDATDVGKQQGPAVQQTSSPEGEVSVPEADKPQGPAVQQASPEGEVSVPEADKPQGPAMQQTSSPEGEVSVPEADKPQEPAVQQTSPEGEVSVPEADKPQGPAVQQTSSPEGEVSVPEADKPQGPAVQQTSPEGPEASAIYVEPLKPFDAPAEAVSSEV
jgi:hypothetical protein